MTKIKFLIDNHYKTIFVSVRMSGSFPTVDMDNWSTCDFLFFIAKLKVTNTYLAMCKYHKITVTLKFV